MKCDIAGNIWFLDENLYCYIAGNACIIYSSESKTQKIIYPSDQCECITSLAVSMNRKAFILCEKVRKGAIISVYDVGQQIKRRKPITLSENGPIEYFNATFSPDNKLLAVQSGAPNYQIYIFVWDKGRLLGTASPVTEQGKTVNSIKFHPLDSSILVVSGKGLLIFYRISEGGFKALPLNTLRRELGDIQAGIFVNEKRCICATDRGDLILFENTGSCIELKTYLNCSPSDGNALYCICPFAKGFICGGVDGTVRVFEESEDSLEYYKIFRTLHTKKSIDPVIHITISPTEDTMLCCNRDCQVYTLSLSNLEMLRPEDVKLELLIGPFHCASSSGLRKINDLSICPRKPLLASCGCDHSIRIWDYDSKSIELYKLFDEEVQTIALHPSGLFIAIGFSSRFKLANILINDIKPYAEFPIKNCAIARYSVGGHFIAASTPSNAIYILTTYTAVIYIELIGHTGKPISLEWADRDNILFSACLGGSIMMWDVKNGIKIKEFTMRNIMWNCITVRYDHTMVYAVGNKADDESTSILYAVEFTADGKQSNVKYEHEFPNLKINSVVYNNTAKTLFLGHSSHGRPGVIQAMRMPLGDSIQIYQCHSGIVHRLALSYEEKYLATCADDGAICVFNFKGLGRLNKENALPYAEEVLIIKNDLEEKYGLLNELKAKVDELTKHNEHQLKLKDDEHEEKVKKLTEESENNIREQISKYAALRDTTDIQEGNYVKKIRLLQGDYEQESLELDKSQKAKIQTEVERYEALCQEREELSLKWDEENRVLRESNERYIQELQAEYEDKLRREKEECDLLVEKKREIQKIHDQTEKDLEDDCDMEIEQMKRIFGEKLKTEKEATLRLKGENGMMKKKFGSLQKQIAEQKNKIQQLLNTEQDRYSTIRGLEKDIIGHKKEIREREETIADKEKRIYELKRKNQELEKFKFVLEYKIKELDRQIEPRQKEIIRLKQQIQEMDQELGTYHTDNGTLDLMITDLKLKENGMDQELDEQSGLSGNMISVIKRFRVDLQNAYNQIEDYKKLKELVIDLFAKYVREFEKQGCKNDADIQEEYNRRREYLEGSVDSLKNKIGKEIQSGHSDKLRLMRENSILTQEINELRREIRFMKQQEKTYMLEKNSKLQTTATTNAGQTTTLTEDEGLKECQIQERMINELKKRIIELGGEITPDLEGLPNNNNNNMKTLPLKSGRSSGASSSRSSQHSSRAGSTRSLKVQ